MFSSFFEYHRRGKITVFVRLPYFLIPTPVTTVTNVSRAVCPCSGFSGENKKKISGVKDLADFSGKFLMVTDAWQEKEN